MTSSNMVDQILAGQDCPKHLKMDQACMTVNSLVSHPVYLWKQLTECYTCDAKEWVTINGNDSVSLLINTSYPLYFYYRNDAGSYFCNTTYSFEEHGHYEWNITTGCPDVILKQNPDKTLIPLLLGFLTLALITILLNICKCVYQSGWSPRIWIRSITFNELQNDLGEARTPSPSIAGRGSQRCLVRVQSLDTLRGIYIAIMIFVNYGGGRYTFFRHAPWNGMTIADIVFPGFLWIMGLSLMLSLRSQLRNNRSRLSVFGTFIKRSLVLIVIGLLLNSFGHHPANIAKLRIPGVLQRIGLAHLIVTAVEVFAIKIQGNFQDGFLTDIMDGWVQLLSAAGLALLWASITFFTVIPGCGAGYLGPGGLHDHGLYVNCTGGAAGYIDRQVFGPDHMYQHQTSTPIYDPKQPYDPEGLLGSLTAAVITLLGAHAGQIMISYSYNWSRINRWIAWGVVLGLFGGALCGFSKETSHMPINKNLFSLSFVFVTSSISFISLAIIYILVDVKGLWTGTPFKEAGMNSILLYMCHEVTKNMIPWSWKPVFGNNTHTEVLFMNLWGALLWVFIAFILYKKRIFLRI